MFASVVIPSFNGAHLLPSCLDSLRKQTHVDFEVVVVDNASSDGSGDLLRSRYPEVRVLSMGQNLFFSGAVNAGIRASTGETVALLNNDTEVEPDWLAELCRALGSHSEAGMAASKILLFDRRDIINSAGDFYSADGIPGNRGVWEEDRGQYDREEEVFGACAGAALYRRRMLEDIGLFDEDLVAYCEDVDLNWRAQLCGWTCVYVPSARVYHRLSSTGGGSFASYYCGRNFVSVVMKDMPGPLLSVLWPSVLTAQIGLTLEAIRHLREPAARARLRGQLASLGQVPLMLRKRRDVQSRVRIDVQRMRSLLRLAPLKKVGS